MPAVTKAQALFDLTGEVALVTGASSGLGARFAEVLAAHGAKVVLAARRRERIAALAGQIGAGALAVELDVADRAAIAPAFAAAASRFGTVTILVNNAGISDGSRFLETEPEAYAAVMRTNVDAVWHLSQEFAKRAVAADRPGAIINIASILATRVTAGVPAYCVSKAAVLQMTSMLALELARHRIRVNAISPGYFVSEMTEAFLASDASASTRRNIPLRRVGEPADLDGVLLLLASNRAAGFMTGAAVTVDGGHLTQFR